MVTLRVSEETTLGDDSLIEGEDPLMGAGGFSCASS
jgi:hypothetical protein